jgi:hypothetical protein
VHRFFLPSCSKFQRLLFFRKKPSVMIIIKRSVSRYNGWRTLFRPRFFQNNLVEMYIPLTCLSNGVVVHQSSTSDSGCKPIQPLSRFLPPLGCMPEWVPFWLNIFDVCKRVPDCIRREWMLWWARKQPTSATEKRKIDNLFVDKVQWRLKQL